MSTRLLARVVLRRISVALFVCTIFGVLSAREASASAPDETVLDAPTLSQMELRADRALAHDQCFLYTEVLHGLTELAGRQLASGSDDDAGATLKQIDALTTKIEHASAKDAKRLKNAEQLLEHTSHRLADMARVASSEQRAMMQTALRHLNAVHTDVLTMVFAH